MKMFINLENKNKCAMSVIILYLFSIAGMVFYRYLYFKVENNISRGILLILVILCMSILILDFLLLIIQGAMRYDAYHILDGRLLNYS